MKTTESPGAVAALGASVCDQLRRQVIAETNRQQSLAQAPIPATPVGDDVAEVTGLGDGTGFAMPERWLGEFDALSAAAAPVAHILERVQP
jgi:hypothetical protein